VRFEPIVVVLSACASDAATQTTVNFGAGPDYTGAIVTLEGQARVLDPIGSAQWLAMPGLEEPSFSHWSSTVLAEHSE
jgi:hypothetical protein